MEILHFCPSRSFSGLEQYALQIAVNQKENGRQVAFVVSPSSKLEGECRKANIPTIPFNPFNPLWAFQFWPLLHKLLNHQKNLKVLHLHSTQEIFHVSLPVLLRNYFNRLTRPKVVLQSHIWISHKKKDVFHRLLYSIVDEVWCS